MNIYHLLYVSKEALAIDSPTVQQILQSSKRNNATVGVTGILVHRNGQFLQCLEGEKTIVKSVYRKICHDTRHKDPQIILEFADEDRLFPNWSMGLITKVQDLENSVLLQQKISKSDQNVDEGPITRLLDLFKTFTS